MPPPATATSAASELAAGGEVRHAGSFHLTAGIARGDEAAFATFYDFWFDRLLAMARATTRRDEAFCLDVVQDCMLRVVQKLPRLADEAAVAAWLARVLLRVAVDRLRQDARRARREDATAAQQPGRPEAADELADAEQRVWLQARLAELPPQDRALLRARFDEGLTLEQTGHALGVSGDAAHGRIRRVLARLKAAAKGAFDG